MNEVFEKYLLLLRQDPDDKTEHSDRGALETLLNKAAHAASESIPSAEAEAQRVLNKEIGNALKRLANRIVWLWVAK
jgi:hypothetical protein